MYFGILVKELVVKCGIIVCMIYCDFWILDRVVFIMNEGYGKGYWFIGNFVLYLFDFME